MRIRNSEDTAWILDRARELGFDLCGVVRPGAFPELDKMQEWLARGYAGEMRYLENPKRRDPRKAKEGIHSAIVCAVNYNAKFPYSTRASQQNTRKKCGPRGWVSRYAWGSDYHEELWRMLNSLARDLREKFGDDVESYACADTGPVHERVLAKYAGLGWIGKNTLLLNRQLGSWLFLGVILTSLELYPSVPAGDALPSDLCGSCRKCIDACPTGAFVQPYVMDARRCISYLTIELRGAIPREFRDAVGWHVFGCDICQDVCPWNRKSLFTSNPAFQPRGLGAGENPLLLPSLEWLAGMTPEEFQSTFRGSAVKRTKWRGMIRNSCIALGNAGRSLEEESGRRILKLLEALSQNEDSVIAQSAQWALSRIKPEGQQSNSGQGAASSGIG